MLKETIALFRRTRNTFLLPLSFALMNEIPLYILLYITRDVSSNFTNPRTSAIVQSSRLVRKVSRILELFFKKSRFLVAI